MKTWFKYIKPYIAYFIIGPVCMIIEVIGEVLMPTFLAKIINLGTAFQNFSGYVSEIISSKYLLIFPNAYLSQPQIHSIPSPVLLSTEWR